MTTKRTAVRLPTEPAESAEAIARVQGTSLNGLVIDSLASEVERVRNDADFTKRAKALLTRDA
jgi:predicted HicB family RNase H-like nuclease